MTTKSSPQADNRTLVEAADELLLGATAVTSNREGGEPFLTRARLLWMERWTIGKIAAVAVALAVVLAFLIPSRYESVAHLMPPEQNSGRASALLDAFSGGGSLLSSLAAGSLGLGPKGALFVGVLGSTTVQDGIIRKFDLQRVYGKRYLEDTRKMLANNSAIAEDRKSGIISVAVTDRSPQRAAAIAAEYVVELNRVLGDLNTSSAHRERVFLEQRLEEVRSDLEDAEKSFGQFASTNSAIDLREQGRATVTAAAELQGQIIAAQAELEGLRQIYTADNVRVRSVRARIGELQQQLQKLAGKSATAQSSASDLYPPLRQLPLLGVPYADLYRRVRVEEAVFETLTKEYELAKVEEVREMPAVKVLDQPQVPNRRSYPPRLLMLLGGFAIGIVAGCGFVLGRDQWRNTDASDPRKAFALEVWSGMQEDVHWNSSNGAKGNGLKDGVFEDSKSAKPE